MTYYGSAVVWVFDAYRCRDAIISRRGGKAILGSRTYSIVDRLAADPKCGVLIPGGNGIRKVRFAFGARGKSGGARVIYLFGGQNMPIFILAVFAKNEKANLSAAERNALGKMVDILIRNYRGQK